MIPLAPVGGWLLSNWRVVAAAVVIGAALYGAHVYVTDRVDEAVAAVRGEYAQAAATQAIAALNTTKKQERASEESANRYERRLAELRAARLRDQSANRAVPAVPDPASPADGTRAELATCRDDGFDVFELNAESDAIQLDELQQWVRRQWDLTN